jgi:RNA polymerase sigma-70 factor (ECF subfamily)
LEYLVNDLERRGPGQADLGHGAPREPQLGAAIGFEDLTAADRIDAATAADTDWRQIVMLYDQLTAVAPSPIVALNRAVAVAEVDGAHAALTLVDALDLDRYYLFHAIRAELLHRLGRTTEAATAYDEAIARAENAAELGFLRRARTRIPE